ncbi:uncharacterized protein METZ01_LOCUS112317, partial [marine metagenome]
MLEASLQRELDYSNHQSLPCLQSSQEKDTWRIYFLFTYSYFNKKVT